MQNPEILIIGAAIIDVLARPVNTKVFDTGSYPVEDIHMTTGGDALNEATILTKTEVSIGDAIRHAGNLLGHLHTGECNRMVPGKGRMPWREIGDALQDIKYDGNVVMEPFVRMGGQVGSDIKIWRDISRGASEAELDADAKRSVEFQRYMLDWK